MDNKVNEFLAIKGLKNRLKWINDNLEDTQLLYILKIVKLKLNATVHGNTLLYIAIKNHGDDSLPGNNNNLKAITLLINAGADPNIHADLSPLMMTQISPQGWATQRPDNTIITQLLIDAGANINAKNISTALFLALQYRNIDSINLLLQNGADPNIPCEYNETPLQYALRFLQVNLVKTLLRNGADPNLSLGSAPTPLCIAMKNNNIDNIELLLQNGADPNKPSGRLTPLYLALIMKYSRQVLEILLKAGANPNIPTKITPYFNASTTIKDMYDVTPLQYAIKNGMSEIVELFEQSVNSFGKSIKRTSVDINLKNASVDIKYLLSLNEFWCIKRKVF